MEGPDRTPAQVNRVKTLVYKVTIIALSKLSPSSKENHYALKETVYCITERKGINLNRVQ